MKKETNNKNKKTSKITKKQERIKQENIEKMGKKIEENKKISSQYFEKIKNLVFINVIIAIILSIYFFVINYLLINIELSANILRVTSFIIAIFSVLLFGISYKKDNGYIFIHGAEAFIISFITLYITNLYRVYTNLYNIIILYLPLSVVIYYLIKALIIYMKLKKEDSKQKNDISEIVKKGK